MNQDQLSQTPLNLLTISTISKSLESIVTELYGPNGYKILLSSATGHVMVTNDSGSIFNSLHLSHPLAKFIIESLQNTLLVTFDNGKTFILYLSAMLDGIMGEFKLDSRREQMEELNSNQLTKTKVARLLHMFLQDLYPRITRSVQEQLITYYEKTNIPVAIGNTHFRGTIKGVMSPHFTPKLTDFFTDILHEMFSSFSHSNDFSLILQLVADNFNIFHCKVPNQPYTFSRCISSVIIQRDFTVYCDSLKRKPVRFVLCQFSISMQEKCQISREIISVRSASKATKFIVHQMEKLKSFLDHCIEKEINLVLSSEKFPDYALQLFQERNISLIHCVLEEDIEFIKLVSKCQALLDLNEKMDNHLNIASASSCSQLDLGTKLFINLDIGDQVPKTLIISAPTDGLCSNVALVINKAIKYLLFALKSSIQMDSALQREVTKVQREVTTAESTNLKNMENNECLQIRNDNLSVGDCFKDGSFLSFHYIDLAPGGGALDFTIAKVLSEFSHENLDVEMKTVCKIVQNAMLRIPNVLHSNNSLCSLREKTREFQKLQMNAFKKLDDGDILGINRKGELTNMLIDIVLESVYCKFYVICSVIQTLIQILKMDFILGVKKLDK